MRKVSVQVSSGRAGSKVILGVVDVEEYESLDEILNTFSDSEIVSLVNRRLRDDRLNAFRAAKRGGKMTAEERKARIIELAPKVASGDLGAIAEITKLLGRQRKS